MVGGIFQYVPNKNAQHSVHPTGGSRRVFRRFAWLEVGSGKLVFSPPAHPPVTHPVGLPPDIAMGIVQTEINEC